ncbi:hypothetical protein FZF29_12795 [Salmonella enterica subsp. enterica serovar Brunei]|nr:hypothetical protein [Salmonella enterica subsp. enterica serovar Brunei]
MPSGTRNSPLWVSNPKQQIAYLGVKYWARLYCPEVILGVYSPDEVEQREEREINPAPVQRMSVQEITSEVSTRTSAQESAANVDAVADDLRERIDTGLKPGTITRARKESWMLGREYLHISPDGNPKPSSECIYNREAVDQWIEAQKKNQPGAKTT